MAANTVTDNAFVLPSWAKPAVIALGIVVIGYVSYRAWSGEPAPPTNMMCVSEGCMHAMNRSPQLGDMIPLVCDKCGQKTVYPAFLCPQCKTPNVWNEYTKKKPPTICRNCGRECNHD